MRVEDIDFGIVFVQPQFHHFVQKQRIEQRKLLATTSPLCVGVPILQHLAHIRDQMYRRVPLVGHGLALR